MKKILTFLMCIIFVKSYAQKENVKLETYNLNENMEKEQLIKQLKSGHYTGGDEFESYNYTEEDLIAIIPFLSNTLKVNGYKFLPQEDFKLKIKNIFGRTLDYSSDKRIIMIDYFDKCYRNPFYTLMEIYFNTYIIKENSFITNVYAIPQIIDYKNKYPDLIWIESNSIIMKSPNTGRDMEITRWKDIPDLDKQRKFNIDLLVNRNLYLFNDDKSRLMWLLANDSYFMESLVLTFGWTKDEKLLKWVIENNRFDKNNPKDYGSLFWTKQCDGKVKLHSDTFKLLQKKYIDPNEPKRWIILDDIKDYIEYLGDIDESKHEDLSAVDRVKILANMAYFAEQFKYDEDYKDYNLIMGRLRVFLGESDRKILKDNNYFGLPKFKEWWDNADYDEYYLKECEYGGVCGRDYQPLDYSEWRKQNPK